MLNLFLNYKSILIRGGIILSIVGSIAGYIYLLKSDIKNCQAIIVIKDHNISELQKTITLLELNNITKVTNKTIEVSSNNVFENIKRLQELERKENDKNITSSFDNVLNGMYFKSNY